MYLIIEVKWNSVWLAREILMGRNGIVMLFIENFVMEGSVNLTCFL